MGVGRTNQLPNTYWMEDIASDAFTYVVSLGYGSARKKILYIGKRGKSIKILKVGMSDFESLLFHSP